MSNGFGWGSGNNTNSSFNFGGGGAWRERGDCALTGLAPRRQIWELQSKINKWQAVADLEGSRFVPSVLLTVFWRTGHTDTVHDVAWAPNMGRQAARSL